MKKLMIGALALVPIMAMAELAGDTPDEKHAWSVHDENRPTPIKVTAADKPGNPPSDAIVLFDGSKESLKKNWCDGKGQDTKWSYSDEGYFYCRNNNVNGGGIFTREHFGDCQLHVEYRHDPKELHTNFGPQMRGNSGVFLMGPKFGYEVQVLDSYYTSKEFEGKSEYVANYADGQAGAVYAENPPLVNPARKPGEWQVYDIVFHQPIWKDGKMVKPGSLTVFFNGVLVQDHWEMEGQTTWMHRRPCKEHPTKGPLHFQDHGCVVHYRNVWYRPLPSREKMSAEEVMKTRRETAAKLFAKIKDPKAATAQNVMALAEVIAYANEGEYAKLFKAALEGYRVKKGNKEEVKKVNEQLNVLIRNKILNEEAKIK